MHIRYAHMPLATYPEAVADTAILAAARFAVAQGCKLHVSAYSVDIPQMHSPLGGLLLDVSSLVRAAEEKSKAECRRLKTLLEGAADVKSDLRFSIRNLPLGAALDVAATEARYHDLSVLPWLGETGVAQDMAEAVVFGSGRPAILVPPTASPDPVTHVAIAWDASQVAARALGDALSLLPDGGRVSVVTVRDEKPLSGTDVAELLAASLTKRGYKAKARSISLGGKTIAESLQSAALEDGAQLLAMGGFGHSRLRDFVLGGATKGVLTNLKMPALLSH